MANKKEIDKVDKRKSFSSSNWDVGENIFLLFLIGLPIFALGGAGLNALNNSINSINYFVMLVLVTEIFFMSFLLCYKKRDSESMVSYTLNLKFFSLTFSLFATAFIGFLMSFGIWLYQNFSYELIDNILLTVGSMMGIIIILCLYLGINALLAWLSNKQNNNGT